jgi:hypothetical protein
MSMTAQALMRRLTVAKALAPTTGPFLRPVIHNNEFWAVVELPNGAQLYVSRGVVRD